VRLLEQTETFVEKNKVFKADDVVSSYTDRQQVLYYLDQPFIRNFVKGDSTSSSALCGRDRASCGRNPTIHGLFVLKTEYISRCSAIHMYVSSDGKSCGIYRTNPG